MKKENNYYIDENNNKWNCDKYTESQAIKFSESLINCSDCSDCSYCSDCRDCRNCSDCSDCSDCRDCSYCRYCRNCSDCSYCRNCSDCSYCSDCRDCSDCSYCRNCSDCSDFKTNPQIYTTPKIGSRDSQTIFYFYDKKIFVVCGCWKSDLIEFEERVKNIYPSGEHRKNYLSEIKKVRTLFNV